MPTPPTTPSPITTVSDDELAQYMHSARSLARSIWRSVRVLDLDDMVSEANVALVEALASYDPTRGASKSTYIFSYVRWRLWDMVRESIGSRNPEKAPRFCQLSQAAHLAEYNQALDNVLYEERENIVEKALERLSPSDSLVIRLRYRDGFSFTKISEVMGYARGTVWARCYRAVKRLRRSARLRSVY